MTRDELKNLTDLVWGLCNGSLPPEEESRLEQILANNTEARALYVRYLGILSVLHWNAAPATREAVAANREVEASSQAAEISASVRSLEPRRPVVLSGLRHVVDRLSRPIPFSVLFASVFMASILTVLGMWGISRDDEPTRAIRPFGAAPTTKFVARLTGVENCRWDEESESLFRGQWLQNSQVLHLLEGIAEITFDRGAVALVEGPARFVVDGENRGRLDAGRLVARIENKKAAGFEIRTPTATVVDIGTEFGVEVALDQSTHVEVFAGLVEYRPIRASGGLAAGRRLSKGEAVQIDAATRQATAVASRASSFVRTLASAVVVEEAKEIWLGNELVPREHAADGRYEVLVAYINTPVPVSGVIGRFAFYKQTKTGESHNFHVYVFRPTGRLGEFEVIFDSGKIDTTKLAGGQVHQISIDPIAVEPGDVIAHFGHGVPFGGPGERGVPYSTRSPEQGPPITQPELGELLTLGFGRFPFDFAYGGFAPERRTYSLAAHFVQNKKH